MDTWIHVCLPTSIPPSLAAGAAGAQDREGQARRRESGRAVQQGHAQRREAAPQAAPRASEGRRQESARAASRESERRTYTTPRTTTPRNDGRPYSAPQAEARSNVSARTQAGREAPLAYSGGRGDPRAMPRQYDRQPSPAYRPDSARGYPQYGGGRARYETRGYVRPPHYQPYRPLYVSRPYYGFRPHVHIGFGVWLGVSVPYPWAYFGTYRPRVYGYYSREYYGAAPGMYQYGGHSGLYED